MARLENRHMKTEWIFNYFCEYSINKTVDDDDDDVQDNVGNDKDDDAAASQRDATDRIFPSSTEPTLKIPDKSTENLFAKFTHRTWRTEKLWKQNDSHDISGWVPTTASSLT